MTASTHVWILLHVINAFGNCIANIHSSALLVVSMTMEVRNNSGWMSLCKSGRVNHTKIIIILTVGKTKFKSSKQQSEFKRFDYKFSNLRKMFPTYQKKKIKTRIFFSFLFKHNFYCRKEYFKNLKRKNILHQNNCLLRYKVNIHKTGTKKFLTWPRNPSSAKILMLVRI